MLCRTFPTLAHFVQPFINLLIDIAEPTSTVVHYSKECLPAMEAIEITRALKRLVEKRGEYCPDHDLVVKSCTTRTGRLLYVVIALNGAGPAIEDEIDPVCRRRSGCGSGVWVLRESEVSQILEKADDDSASD